MEKRISDEEAKKLLHEREANSDIKFDKDKQEPESIAPKEAVTSLGKSEAWKMQQARGEETVGGNLGWKPFPLEGLPSKGMFYLQGTTLEIRSADVGEIRHYSTIDE